MNSTSGISTFNWSHFHSLLMDELGKMGELEELDISACAYNRPGSGIRFYLLSIASVIAVFGMWFNMLLSYVFMRRLKEPNLAFLAALDCLLCLCYIMLFQADACAHYLQWKFLYNALFIYTIPMLVVSRVVQICIPFVLILTSVQKWAVVVKHTNGRWRTLHSTHGRLVMCVSMLVIAIFSRVPMLWAFKVHDFPLCEDHLRSKEFWPTDLQRSRWYPPYDLFLTCAQVFVPLVLLILVNGATVLKLHYSRRRKRVDLHERYMSLRRQYANANGMEPVNLITRRQAAARLVQEVGHVAANEHHALKSMGVIVFTYVICNTLHCVLFVVEKTGLAMTPNNGWSDIYLFSSDTVSFMFMLCSAIRLVIYYVANPTVRTALRDVCCGWRWPEQSPPSPNALLEVVDRKRTVLTDLIISTGAISDYTTDVVML